MKKILLSVLILLVGGLISVKAQFLVFDDALVPEGAQLLNANSGSVNEISDLSPFSGTNSIKISFAGSAATANWGMAYIVVATGADGVDLSEYAEGYLNFVMKTSSTSSFNVRITDGTNKPKINFVAGADPYGFVRDGEWHKISIPVADFITLIPALNMAAIKEFFVWRSGASDNTGWIDTEESEFFIDDISISKTVWETTGLKNLSSGSVSVYPNPSSGIINVAGVKNLKANIYSITGQVVKSVNQTGNQLNISNLPSGVYFITGQSEGKSFAQKIVKR